MEDRTPAPSDVRNLITKVMGASPADIRLMAQRLHDHAFEERLPPEATREFVRQLGYEDLDAFCACYADDAVLAGYNGEITNRGLASIRERHAKLFADFPQNQAILVNRIVVGSNVIDHEKVSRAPVKYSATSSATLRASGDALRASAFASDAIASDG